MCNLLEQHAATVMLYYFLLNARFNNNQNADPHTILWLFYILAIVLVRQAGGTLHGNSNQLLFLAFVCTGRPVLP